MPYSGGSGFLSKNIWKIFLSDLEYWDPANVVFNVLVIRTKDSMSIISEYNIAMQRISSGYQCETIYRYMINNVNVKLPTTAVSVKYWALPKNLQLMNMPNRLSLREKSTQWPQRWSQRNGDVDKNRTKYPSQHSLARGLISYWPSY